MFTAHEVGEKEADNFIPAHCKKHNKLSTCTHTHTQGRDKWEAELQATMKQVHLERRPTHPHSPQLTSVLGGSVHGRHAGALLAARSFLHGEVDERGQSELVVAAHHLLVDAVVYADLLRLGNLVLVEEGQLRHSVRHHRPEKTNQQRVFLYTLSLSGNWGCLTWVRLQQLQEQRYPVLQVHAG